MNIKRLLVVGIYVLLQTSVGAATEYLRFEGTISSNYFLGFNQQFDVDFEPSQSIYFDFQIDTELDRVGVSDSDIVDYFQSTLIGGTLGGGELSFGASGRVIEYLFGFVTLNSGLQLISPITTCELVVPPPGCSLDNPVPPFDWQVGASFTLNPAWDTQESLGNLTLTYRGSLPPPQIPLPAAFWLMLSGLVATGWFARSTR